MALDHRGTQQTQQGVVFASGERWNQERRFILEIFKKFGVGRSKFEDQIETESKCLIEEIAKLKGEQFDPNHVLVNAVSNVIVSVIFGKRYEYSDERFKYFLDLGTQQAKNSITNFVFIFVPVIAHLPFGKQIHTGLTDVALKLTDFVSEIIKNHKRDLDTESHRDLIDAYLSELRFNENGSSGKLSMLNEFNLTVTIKQMFIAGTDTTALTLRWAMLYMALNPTIQKNVHDEIDEAVGRNRLPKLADKPNLQYTQAVLLEIQRMASISRLGVPHGCTKTTTVRGVTIPEGFIVVSNLWAVHRDPDLWPEPWKFKPERFLDDNGQVVNRDELIPFSTGRRICLGESLARMELYIFFTHLMHQFRIEGSNWKGDTVSIVDQGRNPNDYKIRAIHRD
ncbi:cytochrome P450 2U1-like [Amphiura filiformis]|uniref:cytochrome P450 2U1-like n=1 Tax=Amphiura filiformis TaxID=82378 RepID=UPI003B20E5AE